MSATPTTLQTLSDNLAALADRTAKLVAGVHGGSRRGTSGLIWQDGIVVTANDALRHEADLRLALPDGGIAPAALIGRDPTTDIAILRAADLRASVPPPSTEAQTGALVLAVGRRNGAPVARLGIIAEVGDPWRSMRGGQIDRLIRLDLRLDQAMEGGAVIDAAGALLGMAVFGPRGRALVIPSQTIARIVPRLLVGGSLARGYLGLGLHR
ncbi:MAG: S1C family serine protease, partial [Acetobacteraceae bacterium]